MEIFPILTKFKTIPARLSLPSLDLPSWLRQIQAATSRIRKMAAEPEKQKFLT